MRSVRWLVMVSLGMSLSLPVIGCNSGDGPAAAASGKATTTATASPAGGKMTKASFDAAWKAVYMSNANMMDPAEKKAAALEAKVGKPAKVEGNKKIWWAYDGADCYREELGKDGTKGDEKVSADKCGK